MMKYIICIGSLFPLKEAPQSGHIHCNTILQYMFYLYCVLAKKTETTKNTGDAFSNCRMTTEHHTILTNTNFITFKTKTIVHFKKIDVTGLMIYHYKSTIHGKTKGKNI